MVPDEFLSDDSDAELQEAFAKKILKPGLNIPVIQEKKKVFVNNVSGLKKKLMEIENNYKWIERLDLVNKPAAIAPELAMQIEEQESKVGTNALNDLDEFKRETNFHRQAQAAVLEGLARLKAMGIPTRRPEDYFAEMAKSDEHMQKVRTMLVKKQAETERVEKVRKFRQQKKMAKELRKEGLVRKQNEKKAMLDEVKKFRKGVRKDLDFLESNKSRKPKPGGNKGDQMSKAAQLKRRHKDAKFGFGGKKRGMKANTRDSSADDDFRAKKKFVKPGQKNVKPGQKNKMNKRPGKNVRHKIKARRGKN